MESFAPNTENIINRYHPGFFAMIDDNRADSFANVQRISDRFNQKRGTSTQVSPLFTSLYLLLARWRHHRAIYRFDPTLWECLVEQAADVSDTEVLPSEFILHLPYDCIQIEGLPVEIVLNALGMKPAKYLGSCLISVIQPGELDREYPSLYMIWENENRKGTEDFYLPIVPGGTITDCYTQLRSVTEDDVVHQQSSVAMTRIAIQFVLYLMAVNADVEEELETNEDNPDDCENKENGEKPRRRRHKANHKKPKNNLMYHVGYHVGQSLRDADASQNHVSGITIRPHIRRGHWQHYWRGPHDGERERFLKWKSPIIVKGDMGDDLPTVITVK